MFLKNTNMEAAVKSGQHSFLWGILFEEMQSKDSFPPKQHRKMSNCLWSKKIHLIVIPLKQESIEVSEWTKLERVIRRTNLENQAEKRFKTKNVLWQT